MGEKPLTEQQRDFAEKLFRDNYKLLSVRIYELLKNVDPSAVEDCLGNLFLTLCLSAEKIMQHENPRAWLFLTAKYISLKHIRNIGAEAKKCLPITEDAEKCIADESSLEDTVVNDILYSQWENTGIRDKLLSELNENEREIIRLKFQDGLSNSDIGKKLGKSEDAIRFTVYYVKKKITEKVYSL